MDKTRKVSIGSCLSELHKTAGHEHRLGMFGHYAGIALLFLFVMVLVPMFIFFWLFNKIYFWFYNEKSVDPKPFFHFDRHRIAHLSFTDRIACEYCEWANGALQWGLEIANKVERRFCPIQNSCDPHCEKAKEWRKSFLPFKHTPEEMEEYYRKYPHEEK